MATVKKQSLGNTEKAWVNFFESFNYPIITVDEENFIHISDVYKFKPNGLSLDLYFQDTLVNSNNMFDYHTPALTTAVCGANFVWVTLHGTGSLAFFYETVGGKHLYAWVYSHWHDPIYFKDIGALTDIDTEYQYTHNSRLKFNAEPGAVLYTSDALFQGDTKIVIDPNFLACTYLPQDQLVVFKMQEFYTLSNYIVVPLGVELDELTGIVTNTGDNQSG